MAWPTVVPILGPKDITRFAWDGGDGTHCLDGWRKAVFGPLYRKPGYKAQEALTKACGQNILCFNDDKKNSKTKIAKVWNDTMAELGYCVSCNRPTGNTDA